MRITQLINPVSFGCRLVVISIALGLSSLSFAAEVKPIAVEVVGQPGTQVPVAPPAAQTLEPGTPATQANEAESAEAGLRQAERLAQSWAQQAHQREMEHSRYMGEALTDILIPVLAISLIFGGPIVLVIFLVVMRSRARIRREKLQSENIARLLEAGRDVPLELLLGAEVATEKAENNLRKGIENLCIGTGLLIFLTIFLGIGIGAVGFIVIGYGISRLAVWKWVDSKRPASETKPGITQD